MFTCAKCFRNIQKDDEFFALGRKWHSYCWSCSSCGKKLAYNECAEISMNLYCSSCRFIKVGPSKLGIFMTRWNRDQKIIQENQKK